MFYIEDVRMTNQNYLQEKLKKLDALKKKPNSEKYFYFIKIQLSISIIYILFRMTSPL